MVYMYKNNICDRQKHNIVHSTVYMRVCTCTCKFKSMTVHIHVYIYVHYKILVRLKF